MHSLVGISWHMWYAKVWHGRGRVGVGAQVGAMPGAPVGARHSVMGGLATVWSYIALLIPVCLALVYHSVLCFGYPCLLCFGLSQCGLVSCGCGITKALLEELEPKNVGHCCILREWNQSMFSKSMFRFFALLLLRLIWCTQLYIWVLICFVEFVRLIFVRHQRLICLVCQAHTSQHPVLLLQTVKQYVGYTIRILVAHRF